MSNFELENVNIEPEVDEDKIPLNGSPPIDTTKHIIIVIFMVFFFAILLGLIISLFIWGITFIFRFKQTNKQQYVFIIGDWGIGSQGQLNVANAMNNQSRKERPDFIISSGDNFYYFGVDSIYDPLWYKYYENIYNTKENLKNITWYAVLGNHDWYKNISAEMDYNRINPRWNLPFKWYTKEFVIDEDQKIQYIFMDTSPYIPAEIHHNPAVRKENKTLQIDWMRNVLSSGTFRWRFVIGHHPFYSSGHYGNLGHKNMTQFEDLFNEFKIDAYINGHEHILQHSQTNINGIEINYFTSGAGGELGSNQIRNFNLPENKFVVGKTEGFMGLKISRNKATAYFYGRNGDEIYNYTMIKP